MTKEKINKNFEWSVKLYEIPKISSCSKSSIRFPGFQHSHDRQTPWGYSNNKSIRRPYKNLHISPCSAAYFFCSDDLFCQRFPSCPAHLCACVAVWIVIVPRTPRGRANGLSRCAPGTSRSATSPRTTLRGNPPYTSPIARAHARASTN